MRSEEIILNGIEYVMTQKNDGQVMFDMERGVFGCHCNFTVVWNGLGWDLIDIDASGTGVYLSHIVAAADWLERNFKIKFKEGRGTATMNKKLK